MEQKVEFKYKTSLRGWECIVTIKPYLDAVIGVSRWDVDMDDPEKILTVHVMDFGHTRLAEGAIERAMADAGYTAVQLVGR